MSDQITCPFCGRGCNAIGYHEQGKAHETQCPIGGYTFTGEQWAMRPPKKDAPQGRAILSEVEWLRQMVAALTIEPEPKHYAVTYPSNISQPEKPEVIYASREGTAK
jgi:hypothetical protein